MWKKKDRKLILLRLNLCFVYTGVLQICACKRDGKVEKHNSSASLREGSGGCEPDARGPAVSADTRLFTLSSEPRRSSKEPLPAWKRPKEFDSGLVRVNTE